MISEFTIINLQVIASILMGYEFFISHKMKNTIDSWAKSKALELQLESIESINKQINILKGHMPYYVSSVIFLITGLSLFWIMNYSETQLKLIWVPIFLFIPTIFFMVGAFNAVLDKLVIEGLAPMIVPLGNLALSAYLLFTAKGVVSGLGFLFLVASFVCRYYNTSYA